MKTITVSSTNRRGENASFTVSAKPIGGNFYCLKIDAPFEIEATTNGHAILTKEGMARDYSLDSFKLKKNHVSQIVITPLGGTNKDRFTIQFDNNRLLG